MIGRRALLAGAVATIVPTGGRAAAPYRVVYLGTLRREQAPGLLEALESGLRARGYGEGRLVFDVRVADGHPERLPALAAEIVRTRPDVIVAGVNAETAAARQATRTIPIVMVLGNDPVGAGLVASLARPGANVTGLTLDVTPGIWGKRLQLLIEMTGYRERVAFLSGAQVANRDASLAATRDAAAPLGITVVDVVVSSAGELPARFGTMAQQRVRAVVVFADPMLYRERKRIAELAKRYQLPSIYTLRQFVDAGGLLSYGPDVTDLYRRAADYVDRLLNGAKPDDLPVEQPTKFELVVNAKTARGLGLDVGGAMRLRADHVVE